MLLYPDEPPPFETVRERGTSPCVFLCDHASSRLPRRLGDLGLTEAERAEHIAWDIGAARVARLLSERFDAALVLSGYSRLAIDCNRPVDGATSIPEVTCDIAVPGNVGLGEAARSARRDELFWPYHREIERVLQRRETTGQKSLIVSVHSFTPSLYGKDRPWHFGVMYGRDPLLARALIAALSQVPGLVVGDNEPYRVSDGTDYGVPVYAERAGRPGVLLELRNDLVRTDEGVARMAALLGQALDEAIEPVLAARSTPRSDAPGP
jgi:predicted N-formylglutamate amidohydrolase